MAVQHNIFCKNLRVGCYIVLVKSDKRSLKSILLLLCISDIWCLCPRGLINCAYLLTSLPSCLLLISCLPAWSQIVKILGSTSIRHRSDASASDRCLIDVDSRPLLSRVLFWPVLWWPEWCSPSDGYLHVRCPEWWRPHQVKSSYHHSDVTMGAMASQSTGVSMVCSGADKRKTNIKASRH